MILHLKEVAQDVLVYSCTDTLYTKSFSIAMDGLVGRTTFAGLASAGRTSAGRHLPVWTFAGRTSAGPRHLPVGHLPVGTFAGLEKSDHLGLF